ncbi:HEPN family nuclease [Hydrogenophaga sp. ZJX-1]|uniref:HEPN family nuclease n=1 Tax=Hydrogenophaga sp. ZJX-1 TaxID=3404778 RepID=UPI003B286392
MEYENDFELSFMQRTLDLVKEYNDPNEATLLINCLLGLLILPKESLNNSIPSIDFDNLAEWGIQSSSIKALGSCNYGHSHKPNLKQ